MIDILENEIFILMDKIFLHEDDVHPVSVFAHFITNPFKYDTEILADFFESLPIEFRDRKAIVFDFLVEFNCFDVYIFLPKEKEEEDKDKDSDPFLRDQVLKRTLDLTYTFSFLQNLFYQSATKKRTSTESILIIRYCYKTESFFCNFYTESIIIPTPYQGTRDIHIRMVKYVLF